MRIEVKLKKLDKDAIIPTKGTPDAAGADLYALCREDITIAPHETYLMPTGISIELPYATVDLYMQEADSLVRKA